MSSRVFFTFIVSKFPVKTRTTGHQLQHQYIQHAFMMESLFSGFNVHVKLETFQTLKVFSTFLSRVKSFCQQIFWCCRRTDLFHCYYLVARSKKIFNIICHKFNNLDLSIGQVSVQIKMKSFNTLILLSVLAAATTSAWHVDEPAVSASFNFDYIVNGTIGPDNESNEHCTNNFLLALVGIRI